MVVGRGKVVGAIGTGRMPVAPDFRIGRLSPNFVVAHGGVVVFVGGEVVVGEGFEVGEGIAFDELLLVHVDLVGEAEETGGEAGAV